MKKVFIVFTVFSILMFLICILNLSINKTFFKNIYIGIQNQEIFIPKYSYFNKESGMTCASFKSLKSEKY